MLSIPVYNESGQQVGAEELDEACLGGEVKPALLKQAVVMYHANRRQGTVAQLSRGEVEGSTRKLYRQKGTGRARMGSARTAQRRGGGRAFPRKPRDFSKDMPRKMRRLARNHAILARLQSSDAAIVDGLSFDTPKTKRFAAMLSALNGAGGCVFATNGLDLNLYRSGRNIPRMVITPVLDLNAFDVLSRRKLIFTREAFAALRAQVSGGKAGA